MAQIIRVIYDADTTDLQRTRELFKEIAKESGLTEKQVEEISNEIGKQTGLINRLVAAEKQLVAERNKSMNPAQIQKLNAQIAATRAEVDKLTGRVQQAGLNIQKVFQQVGIAISAAFVISKVKDFLVSAVQMAAVMEQNRIAFTNFTGSAEKANALLTKIEKFAARTPFEFPELVEATKQMLAFGISQEDVMENLSFLGDIAAGTGSNLKELAFVFGTFKASGTIFTQDLNQLSQRGIPIIEALAEHFGIAQDQVRKFAADGKIQFKDIETALRGMTAPGEKFFNMMENQSKTALGQFSTLMDNINKRMREIGEVILLVGKPLISFFNNLIGGTEEVTNEFFEQEKELRKTRASLNAYVTSLGSLTQGSEAYKATIDRINQVSPDFFKGLDMQKVSYEEILDRLKEVNSELDINIGLLQRQGVVQQFSEKASEAAENIGQISVRIQELAFGLDGSTKTQFDIAVKRMIEMKVPLEDIIDTIKEWKGNEAAAFRVLAQEFEKNTANLGIYTKAQGDATEALEKYAKENNLDLNALREKNKEQAKQTELTKSQQKEIDDLAKALKKLREEAELAAAGGPESLGGLAILRQRAIDELNANKAITKLTTDELRALELSINAEWDAKELALKKKIAEDAKKIQKDLDAELAADRKDRFDKEVADSKRLSDIKILQAKKDALEGLITEEEMNDRILNAEIENLAARREILKQFGEDTLEIDEEIVDKKIQLEKSITENAAEESEKRKQISENEHDEKLRKFNEFVESVRIGLAIISELAQTSANIDLQDAKARYDREIKLAGDNVEKKSEIEERYAREKEAIQQRLAEQQRRQAIFEIILNTASAAVEALPNVFLVALVTALGLAQLAKARTAQYAEGVIDLKGPGTETSDSIPAMLSRGESVMTARETRMFGPTLRAMRANMLDPQIMNAFATGRLKLPQGSASPAISFSDTGIVRGLSAQTSVSKKMLRKMDEQNRLIAKMNKEQRKLSAKDSYFSRKYKF